MSWRALSLAALIAFSAGAPATQDREVATVWVLPLENVGRDPALEDLARAVSALVTLAFARSSACAVVERERIDAVLAEHALAAAGLSEPGTRRTVGHLLGARWMLHGSLARRGTKLWIAAHITEVESTRILASEQREAEPAELATVLDELAARLLLELRSAPENAVPGRPDPTPVANLHFMRGLGHHYSGLQHRALAEFLRAGAEPALADLSALWRANCYIALEEFEHAFIELAPLVRRGSHVLDPRELAERLARCRRQLSADELRTCEELVLPAAR